MLMFTPDGTPLIVYVYWTIKHMLALIFSSLLPIKFIYVLFFGICLAEHKLLLAPDTNIYIGTPTKKIVATWRPKSLLYYKVKHK